MIIKQWTLSQSYHDYLITILSLIITLFYGEIKLLKGLKKYFILTKKKYFRQKKKSIPKSTFLLIDSSSFKFIVPTIYWTQF